jgi:hypothetical protein
MAENAKTVLDEELFPIVGWAGLEGEMLRPDTMRDMAEAGFTVNHGGDDSRDPVEVLDIAHESGVRMLYKNDTFHVCDDFKLTARRKREIEKLVAKIKDHPGLYMYYLRDEPKVHALEIIGKVARFIKELDPYHLCYVNQVAPSWTQGVPTIEEFYKRLFEVMDVEFLSYDRYPIRVADQATLDAHPNDPWYFPRHKLYVRPDFYQLLDFCRRMAMARGVPFWAFTNAVRHGYHPTPTEGHMRFQLMADLAYGASGLQYFTYAHDCAMVRLDGTTTETWKIARRINRDVHAWAPVLRKLRSIGVVHTGPLWPGTQFPPDMPEHMIPESDLITAEGDPVVIGRFLGPDDQEYLILVSKNPCEWSVVHLRQAKPKPVFEFDVNTGTFRRPYPDLPDRQPLTLAPGEGRLLRLGGEGKQVF